MANSKIKKYLNGYPNLVGNKKQVRLVMRGPNPYVAGGVAFDSIAHVENIHSISCTGAKNATTGRATVLPFFTKNPPTPGANWNLLFINAVTGAEMGAVDLSAYEFVMTVEGTN